MISSIYSRVVPLEETFNYHQVQLLDLFRVNQKLGHIIEGTAQKQKHWQPWAIRHFSKKRVPELDHSYSK